MSLDIKYRPRKFSEVLGQENILKILRRYIATGAQFRQSYLFAGPFGSGKTTLGRILARTMLCSAVTPEGDACDTCGSCQDILTQGTSVDFVEVDAATNSGKADVQKITDEISYATFSGKRHIYLFDESHQLSRDALDAMLKPLEDNIPGSQDKKLICIFCTTEPEKMRHTIISRCAPTFVIHPVSPAAIAVRLGEICKKEGIPYEEDVLVLIAEITECHIRDALKAIEGVSMLGPISRDNVAAYLKLDLNSAYLDVLENLGKDLGAVLDTTRRILERSSPVTCYEKLAEVAMLSYQVAIGAVKKTPSFWDIGRLGEIGKRQGNNLLGFAARFASRPGRPTAAMLLCDLGTLHYAGGTAMGPQPLVWAPQQAPTSPAPAVQVSVPQAQVPMSVPSASAPVPQPPVKTPPVSGRIVQAAPQRQVEGGKNPRAIRQKTAETSANGAGTVKGVTELDPSDFCRLLALKVEELDRVGSGSQGRPNVDHNRADPSGGGQG